MKRKLQIIISASAASVLACSALAQDIPNAKTDHADYSRQPMARPRADQLNGAAKASDLIGVTVKNLQDEKLGKVDDLAVDVESGRVVQVILSTGGFLGVGDTLTSVPPGALHTMLPTRSFIWMSPRKSSNRLPGLTAPSGRKARSPIG